MKFYQNDSIDLIFFTKTMCAAVANDVVIHNQQFVSSASSSLSRELYPATKALFCTQCVHIVQDNSKHYDSIYNTLKEKRSP